MKELKIQWQKEDMESYYTTRAFDWKFSIYKSINNKWSWIQTATVLCNDCGMEEYDTFEQAKIACENKIRKMISDFEKHHSDQ
jgi:hypothetical protein